MSTESKFLIGIGIVTLMIIGIGVVFFSQQKPKVKGVQTDQNLILADARNTIGAGDAPVKIVEFGDFQCPACATAQPIVKTILETNKDKVYFVFRHYPLPTHKNAMVAAKAAEAAGGQDKFFEMHDILYERQKEWENTRNPKEIFERYALEIRLDVNKFREDFDKGIENINKDYALGNQVGVDSTPTFFINGQKYPGVVSQGQFQQLIDRATTS